MAFTHLHRLLLATSWLILLPLTGCSYGPERLQIELENAIAKPNSHIFAVSVEVWRVQDPKGFISTFPNGGVLKVNAKEARIYVVNVEENAIELVARMEEFDGIPQPKSVGVNGWQGDTLFFSLFGYGGHDWRTGDDMSDIRHQYYRIVPGGNVERMEIAPTGLAREFDSGPVGPPPLLRLSKGHLEVKAGVDGRSGQSKRTVRFALDPITAEPALTDTSDP